MPPPGRGGPGASDAVLQKDPLNPKVLLMPQDKNDDGLHSLLSILEMPDAPIQTWVLPRADSAKGVVAEHRFDSTALGSPRPIRVYTPPGFNRSGQPYPVLVLSDGDAYSRVMATPTVLDNLIAAKRIPPIVAVMIYNFDFDGSRPRELGGNPTYNQFLTRELMPWVRKEFHGTSDPRQTIIGGVSMGGFAAAFAALRHPETFGNLLSQSGSLWFTPGGSSPSVDPSWIIQQYVTSPVLPVRFYLAAGSLELDHSGQGSMTLIPARRMRDVLQARGYSVRLQEFHGGHDQVNWRENIAEGLIWLLGTPPTTAAPASPVPRGLPRQ